MGIPVCLANNESLDLLSYFWISPEMSGILVSHAIGLDGTRTTSKLALNCQCAIWYTDFWEDPEFDGVVTP
ncbi:MAG: hypothetical protein ACBR12_27195 [Microcoleus sp.]